MSATKRKTSLTHDGSSGEDDVSRSGRIRKKSAKYEDFASPHEISQKLKSDSRESLQSTRSGIHLTKAERQLLELTKTVPGGSPLMSDDTLSDFRSDEEEEGRGEERLIINAPPSLNTRSPSFSPLRPTGVGSPKEATHVNGTSLLVERLTDDSDDSRNHLFVRKGTAMQRSALTSSLLASKPPSSKRKSKVFNRKILQPSSSSAGSSKTLPPLRPISPAVVKDVDPQYLVNDVKGEPSELVVKDVNWSQEKVDETKPNIACTAVVKKKVNIEELLRANPHFAKVYEGISVPPVEEHSEAPVPSPPLFPLTSTTQPASQKMLLESLDAPDLHEGKMEEEEDEDIKAASPGDSDEAFSLNPNVDLSEFFTCVPGRLSLLSSTPKYCVTVGEIQRRLLPPESLNVSLLGSMLRRAKARNAGQELRGKLNTLGLRIPAGWRRASCPTLLTALVEAEAVMLARDFGRLCETEFPALPLAQFHHSEPEDTSTKPSERLQELLTTRKVLNRLMDTLNRDRSPLCHTSPPPLLPARVQEPMEVFSRLTHGFGTPAIVASLAAVQRYIDESAQLLHKDEP